MLQDLERTAPWPLTLTSGTHEVVILRTDLIV